MGEVEFCGDINSIRMGLLPEKNILQEMIKEVLAEGMIPILEASIDLSENLIAIPIISYNEKTYLA